MTDVIVDRQVKQGRLTISIAERGYAVEIDGKHVLDGRAIEAVSDLALATFEPTKKMVAILRKAGFSHVMDRMVGLHLSEAAALEVARAMTPLGLKDQRARLANNLGGLRETAWNAQDRYVANDLLGRRPTDLTAQIEAARVALADFDAAHPEVIAAIEAAKKAEFDNSFIARGLD